MSKHNITGGEGGIRTHDTVARIRHFQCRALDRTRRPLRTRPSAVYDAAGRRPGGVQAGASRASSSTTTSLATRSAPRKAVYGLMPQSV
jgi:hypothetical protein